MSVCLNSVPILSVAWLFGDFSGHLFGHKDCGGGTFVSEVYVSVVYGEVVAVVPVVGFL